MATINQVKQLAVADTPILFFQCEMPSGDTFYWSSHTLVFEGQQYVARVLKHNLFTLQLSADDAMDGMSQLSIVLGNADATMSELNAAIGFRGAQLTVYFAFVDLPTSTVTTEATMLFRGVAGDPQEITEETLTLNFTNKLSLQRVSIPDVRIQRTCPWNFPTTLAQRQEALNGGEYGRFSKFYRCGYSADVPGGVGNLNDGQPYTSCDHSRTQCLQRGMFNSDAAGHVNNRYGGFEFIPASYLVRGTNDKTSHAAAVIDNTGKANDAVPIVYGVGWLKAPVVFSRNDGNLTHMEVLLGLGEIDSVLKVVVNDVEIPLYSSSANVTATGWYSIISSGTRVGAFNLDFIDASQTPLGDPQGSMAVLSVVVPNAISPGTSTPTVQVLMSGMKVDQYDVDGNLLAGPTISNNPVWVVLDVLQRAGWTPGDLDISTFYQTSLVCDYTLDTTDANGTAIGIARYACNLILNKRQSAATLVRGIRVGASLMLRYGANGLLELLPEATIAAQQPTLPDGSNSSNLLNGGWPVYEFSDSSAGFSGIAKTSKGVSTLTLSAVSIAETFNRVSVEFQDEQNEYQQDSLTVANTYDSDLIGFEVASQSNAQGLPNLNQATRILLRQLDKSTAGNQYIQFLTSFRALKVRPGDIIAVTYLREGFQRAPFRVLKLSPSLNYEMVTITAQAHDDNWYSDSIAVLQLSGRQPNGNLGIPLPLVGTIAHDDSSSHLEYFDFALSDSVTSLKDGSAIDSISIGFAVPAVPSTTAVALPLVSLSPVTDPTTGTLPGGLTWYYAVTTVDSSGKEGMMSFTIPALIPGTSNTNTVTLTNLSFPVTAASFNVYRGESPQALYLIARNQPIVPPAQFQDSGLIAMPFGPPDANFDHANFYYRYEYAGPYLNDAVPTSTTIGWSDMGAVPGAYVNLVVRITDGTGQGQERSILSNTQTLLTISTPWSVNPAANSIFVIAEPAWKLAAISSNSPAQFDISYQVGEVIEVTGRAANIMNQESNPNLAPITRLQLGAGASDFGLPGSPSLGLSTPGGGEVMAFNVGFTDLSNTESVTSGTLQLICWNELDTPSAYSLAQDTDNASGTITLVLPANPVTPFVGQYIQIDQEIMSIISVSTAGTEYSVTRAELGSTANIHNAGALVLPLSSSTLVMPFAPGFFQNRASGNYINTFSLPDVRISAAELFVTNAFGNGQAAVFCYTNVPDASLLRTLSGGQFSLQVNGYLATQQNAAPSLVVQASHAVRDIRLTLNQPPTGYVITVDLLQNGTEYCQLTYDPSQTPPTAVIDGTDLPPLTASSLLTINLTVTQIQNYALALNPGNDLTVTIRF